MIFVVHLTQIVLDASQPNILDSRFPAEDGFCYDLPGQCQKKGPGTPANETETHG